RSPEDSGVGSATGTSLTLRPVCRAISSSGSLPSGQGRAPRSWGTSDARGEPSPFAGILPDAQQLPPRLDGTHRPSGLPAHVLIRHGCLAPCTWQRPVEKTQDGEAGPPLADGLGVRYKSATLQALDSGLHRASWVLCTTGGVAPLQRMACHASPGRLFQTR